MEALGLLTYRPLLRKLDLSCLTAGPLISSVNCRRLCRRGFYRHIPLLKSSRFMTISINSLWDNLRSLWGWWRDHLGGLSFDAPAPSRIHIYTHTFIYIHYMSCVAHSLPSLYLMIRDSPPPLGDGNDSPDIEGERTQSVEWVYRWWEPIVQVNLYLQLNHLTEHRPLY